MKNCETGELAATMESVTVYFDLAARTKLALSEEDRTRLEGFCRGSSSEREKRP